MSIMDIKSYKKDERQELFAMSIEVDTLKTLKEILSTLKEMKQQEFDYWEAWKKAKNKEQTTVEKEGQP